jgi:hypothetical protein
MERAGLRPRTAIIVASLALSLLVAGVIGAITASAQGDVHVVMTLEGTHETVLDFDDDGELRLGDRIAIRAPLVDAVALGDRVGTAYGDCLVLRRITRDAGLWRCTYVLRLADGTINLDGLDPRGPGAYELAVTGGTGVYSGTTGHAAMTDTTTETDIQITFA